MKIKKLAAYLAVVGMLTLTGCSHGQSAQMENKITFSLDNISEVTISYDDEKVTFYESVNDELVIKEYMTENKNSYHAKVDQSDDSIKISEVGNHSSKMDFLVILKSICRRLTMKILQSPQPTGILIFQGRNYP